MSLTAPRCISTAGARPRPASQRTSPANAVEKGKTLIEHAGKLNALVGDAMIGKQAFLSGLAFGGQSDVEVANAVLELLAHARVGRLARRDRPAVQCKRLVRARKTERRQTRTVAERGEKGSGITGGEKEHLHRAGSWGAPVEDSQGGPPRALCPLPACARPVGLQRGAGKGQADIAYNLFAAPVKQGKGENAGSMYGCGAANLLHRLGRLANSLRLGVDKLRRSGDEGVPGAVAEGECKVDRQHDGCHGGQSGAEMAGRGPPRAACSPPARGARAYSGYQCARMHPCAHAPRGITRDPPLLAIAPHTAKGGWTVALGCGEVAPPPP